MPQFKLAIHVDTTSFLNLKTHGNRQLLHTYSLRVCNKLFPPELAVQQTVQHLCNRFVKGLIYIGFSVETMQQTMQPPNNIFFSVCNKLCNRIEKPLKYSNFGVQQEAPVFTLNFHLQGGSLCPQ